MTYRDPIPDPPPCPVCEEATVRNTHLPEQLGQWECSPCRIFCSGTTSEFERYAPHRARRRELKGGIG